MSDWLDKAVTLPEEFDDLNRAIKDNLRVRIVYEAKKNVPYQHVIRPLHLHKLGATYYIVAISEKNDTELTFRLDRITRHQLLD